MDDRERRQYEKELNSYPHQPLGLVRNDGSWPAPTHRFSLAACARWEARYIVEWLIYHRSIGIDHVYLYCNDDDPERLYEQVLPFMPRRDPFVTFRHYSFQGLQSQMYFHFVRNFSLETEWMMFLDVDEFICIRGSNNIATLIDAMPAEADAVCFNWSSFGNSGHKTRPDGSVLLNYTRREPGLSPFTKVMVKSRRVPYQKLFQNRTVPVWHDYTSLDSDIVSYNVIRERLHSYYEGFPQQAAAYLAEGNRIERMLGTAFIAHYNIKSEEDFDIRVRRGLRDTFAGQKMWGDKTPHDRETYHWMTNRLEDRYLSDYWLSYLSCGWRDAVFVKSHWPLVSQGRPATQSSTAHHRTVEEDAATIVSGHLLGVSQNHSMAEDAPWWQIDLGVRHIIHEIRLFNRLDGALDRMRIFEIRASETEGVWKTVLTRSEDALFGGVDGSPFTWASHEGFVARWIRLVVPGGNQYLHLDQIEFYGTPAQTDAQPLEV